MVKKGIKKGLTTVKNSKNATLLSVEKGTEYCTKKRISNFSKKISELRKEFRVTKDSRKTLTDNIRYLWI